MSIATSCAICGYPTTIAETAPRLCPRCLGQPARTREVLEERIIEQEEALARAYAAFFTHLEHASLETLTRYHTLLAARAACLANDERWEVQRRREAATAARGDALAQVLVAEQQLTTACARITIAIDEANALIWDLAQLPVDWSWELPARLVERRQKLPALRIPGQPQLLGLATAAPVDPRPDLTPLPVAAPSTRVARCDECDAPIVWGRTANNKPCPYDADAQGNKTEVSHFSTCTNPKRFSKTKPAKKKVAPKAVAA
jgi:hypothetical protein